jgi:hypothetical protein
MLMPRSFLPLFIALAGLVACAPPTDDEAAVRACYDAYMQAVRNGDGPALADLLDRGTLTHYDRLLQLALTADSGTVAALEAMDRMTVLGLRVAHDRAELENMDGRQVIAGAMGRDKGADMGAFESLGLGSVTVEGDVATASIKLAGFPLPGAKYTFRREDGRWRLDLTSLLQTSSMSMGFKAMGGEKSLDRMLEEALREANNGELPEGIWHGPR